MANRQVSVAYFQGQVGLTLRLTTDPLGEVLVVEVDLVEGTQSGNYVGTLEDVPTGRYVAWVMSGTDSLANDILQHTNAVGSERVGDLDAILSAGHGASSWLSNVSPTVVISAVSPQLSAIDEDLTITIHRGDYTQVGLTVGTLAGRIGEKLFFTVREEKPEKYDTDPLDEKALLQVTEESGALTVKEDAWATSSDGSIVVDDEVDGDIRIILKSAITTLLPIVDSYWYDVQKIRADGDSETVAEGRLNITADVTRRSTVA